MPTQHKNKKRKNTKRSTVKHSAKKIFSRASVKKRFTKKRNTRTARQKNSPIPKEDSAIHIRVFRYDPTIDFTPRTHEYSISPQKKETILELLTRIKHAQDGSLTFRGNCTQETCTGCAVRVNGKPVLACSTFVSDVLDGNHHTLRIDPLVESRVIKDLVIDEKEFFDDLMNVSPRMVLRKNDERRNHRMGVRAIEKLSNSHECTLCGICDAQPRLTHGKLSPAAFVKAYRYIHDERDGNTQRISQLAKHFSSTHDTISPAASGGDTISCPENIFPHEKMNELHTLHFSRENLSKKR